MKIETERLVITEFTEEMAHDVHVNSLDEDNRKFVPDEVFETDEEAREALGFLMSQYGRFEGPLAYPVLTKDSRENIGYVQLVPLDGGIWEIGYHIAKKYTGKGYATEAVRAFLPVMAEAAGIREVHGICLKENEASRHVLLKCGFEPVFEGCGEYQGEKREVFRSILRIPEQERKNVKVYYDDGTVRIRSMTGEDARTLYETYLSYGWHPELKTYEEYLREQEDGQRLVFIAEYEGSTAGICTLVLKPREGPWAGNGWPEIVDLCVFFHLHGRGIASRLMDTAEREASRIADHVFLAVGVHSGYGRAQRLYVGRGYNFDGSGVWYKGKQLEQYAECCNDDDLLLFMSKKL